MIQTGADGAAGCLGTLIFHFYLNTVSLFRAHEPLFMNTLLRAETETLSPGNSKFIWPRDQEGAFETEANSCGFLRWRHFRVSQSTTEVHLLG